MSEDATTQPDDATTQPDDAHDVPERFTVDFSGLTLLGIYKVEKKLADGGMGSVYMGEDTNLGRKVVVKVPHVRFLGEAGFRRRFAREITELVRLEHPHIVRILAQGEHDSVPFFVLQFLGGGSLETRLHQHVGPLPATTALPWFRRVAETLDFVHARNTVHRDVKPANILFDKTGNVYLSDFGVAKALDNEDANLTEAGTGIGSPRYMSPEQGYGRELEASADQYALAASLYEALSGHPPHGEGSAVELLVRKASDDPDPLVQLIDGFPAAASDAIAQGMAREPSQRHESCQALVDAVEQGLGLGTGEVTVQPPAPGQAGHRLSRWVGVGLIVLAAAVGFWALYDDDAPPAPPEVQVDQAVSVLDVGAEPRRVLRYDLRTNASPFFVHMKQDNTSELLTPGGEPQTLNVGSEMRMSLPLESKPTDFGAEITWRLDSVTLEGNVVSQMEKKRDEALRSATGTTGTFRVDHFGARVTNAVKPDELSDDVERLRVASIGQFANDMLIPLPHEPVGVGARWEVVETVAIMGIRFLQTSVYELLRSEGPVLEVRGRLSQAAPSQEFEYVDGQPRRMTSLNGGGSTEVEIRLDRIAPIRRHQSMQISAAFEFPAQDGGTGVAKVQMQYEVWSGVTSHKED